MNRLTKLRRRILARIAEAPCGTSCLRAEICQHYAPCGRAVIDMREAGYIRPEGIVHRQGRGMHAIRYVITAKGEALLAATASAFSDDDSNASFVEIRSAA